MDASELARILRRVAERDRRAFDALYNATSAKLYGIVLRILQRRDVADEILQEAYVKIWEHAAEFDATRSSPITWMVTIARNSALDLRRRKEPLLMEELPELAELGDDDPDPLADRERKEELQQVMQCLEGIETQKREMVLLAYLQGWSREMLAQRFAAPAATIKTWLHRSLAQLRLCMDGKA